MIPDKGITVAVHLIPESRQILTYLHAPDGLTSPLLPQPKSALERVGVGAEVDLAPQQA
ncbi:hypothetical protein V1286_002839 [Bradyrhizobium algeriense]|uniref:Uncharacterized protein n=1 Tax=Bradyrhizobium algeriense TaxID=634784 RepID=A0ABU8B9U1_9BRAD